MIELGERDVERIAGKEANGGLRVHVLREELRDPAVLVENAGNVEGGESQSVGGVVAAAANEVGAGALGLGGKRGVEVREGRARRRRRSSRRGAGGCRGCRGCG